MDEQNVTSFFRFEDLRIYDKSLDYYDWLINKVQSAEESDRKVVLLPFLDTAAKISMQIADGSSNPKAEFIEYLKDAKGLVRKCVVFTTIAQRNNIFSEQEVEESRTMLMEMTKMLGAMIVSFQRSLGNRGTNNRTREEKNTDDYPGSDLEFNY